MTVIKSKNLMAPQGQKLASLDKSELREILFLARRVGAQICLFDFLRRRSGNDRRILGCGGHRRRECGRHAPGGLRHVFKPHLFASNHRN